MSWAAVGQNGWQREATGPIISSVLALCVGKFAKTQILCDSSYPKLRLLFILRSRNLLNIFYLHGFQSISCPTKVFSFNLGS